MSKIKSLFLGLCLLLCLAGCKNENEEDFILECACDPFSSVSFQVTSDDFNVFENGTYTLEDVTITGSDIEDFELTLQDIEIQYGSTTETILTLKSTDWQPQDYALQLNIGNEYSADLDLNIVLSTGECCAGLPTPESISIDGIIQENPYQVIRITLE
ncbi:hypothetical protein [Croceivirga thetidis]|uniref:DUF4382 domain-containing protein n=1 Tax=Croceivirga thetidis TaxID=2721623 RepID=A0ABX1GQ98_9FLAO|nr:hypothetical protein [Croceivirga thetidis]NKI31774.1 hypothetical protein [Croceivirga thetidis]